MTKERSKFAIARWINYKHTSIEGFEKAWKYITGSHSSKLAFQKYHGLRETTPVIDLESIEERYKSDLSGRIYKHFIISFGEPDLASTLAFKALEDIMKKYDDYPYVFAVHDNIPKRIHGHCIMGTRNIKTGKKFEQSPGEFKNFNAHINKILKDMDLPLLRGTKVDAAEEGDDDDVLYSDFIYDNGGYGMNGMPMAWAPAGQMYSNGVLAYPVESQMSVTVPELYPARRQVYPNDQEYLGSLNKTMGICLEKNYEECFQFAEISGRNFYV